MRNLMMAVAAASLAVPATVVLTAEQAVATPKRTYAYREWRGRDGRRYCRRSNCTTGLVVGAAGGALVGNAIDGGRHRAAGTILGAVGGALAGREIERSTSRRRCR